MRTAPIGRWNQGKAPSRQPGNRRRTAASRKNCGSVRSYFRYYDAGLLIVPALFFIQRRNGEVAEWSKALPC
jgi:hypothetical protein